MKLKVFCFILTFMVCNSCFYIVNGYESNIVYSEKSDINSLIKDIKNQINIDVNTLKYSFYLEDSVVKYLDTYSFVTDIQSKVIEYLDGLLMTSPSIKTKIQNKNKVEITLSYGMSFSDDFNIILDALVFKSESCNTTKEKIFVLSNYISENNFTYASDYNTYGKLTSSTVISNPLATAEGVINNKKGICVGYANLMSVYLEKIGVPNLRLRGVTPEGDLHTWNIAYFESNGEVDWYYIDLLYALKKSTLDSVISTSIEYNKYVNWDESIKNDLINIKYPNKEYRRGIFLDIKDYWAEKEIITLGKKGIISGYPDMTFKPFNNITKGELILLLYRVTNKNIENNNLDIACNFFVDSGYFKIKEEWLKEYVTREELAYYLYGIIKNKSYIEPVVIDKKPIDFDDIEGKYREAVLNMFNFKIMQGVDTIGTFSGKNNVSRGEISAVLYRVISIYEE